MRSSYLKWLVALALLVSVDLTFAQQGAERAGLVRFQRPETLHFDELVKLATVDPPPAELQAKLDRILNQPFINNEAALSGTKPIVPTVAELGPVLRIAEWNINRTPRGQEVQQALAEKDAFLAAAHANPKLKPKTFAKVTEQIEYLQQADVIVLDEIDDGVARSHYQNTPRVLAKALHMNYAFAVEFIELDNIYYQYSRDGKRQPPSHDDEKFGNDPERDRALEGTALLSRYPIRAARIIRLPVEYDWYHEEIKPLTFTQKIECWYAANVFKQRVQRQIRRGSRVALVVDLEVPQSPTGIVTVVCPHLENYTNARGRREQVEYLLPKIAPLTNPVVVTGDLNTISRSAHPARGGPRALNVITGIPFWLPPFAFFVNPFPGILFPVNGVKNSHNPTAQNWPVLAPSYERGLFDELRQFQFADGTKFVWKTDKRKAYQERGGVLASSNQRDGRGFEPTFFFGRTLHGFVGEYKIDWFFVKENAGASAKSADSLQFAPFFGRTFPEMNTALGKRISDHRPSTLDLPLTAPDLASSAAPEKR